MGSIVLERETDAKPEYEEAHLRNSVLEKHLMKFVGKSVVLFLDEGTLELHMQELDAFRMGPHAGCQVLGRLEITAHG